MIAKLKDQNGKGLGIGDLIEYEQGTMTVRRKLVWLETLGVVGLVNEAGQGCGWLADIRAENVRRVKKREGGLRCPYCGAVLYRQTDEQYDTAIRRYRKCPNGCWAGWTVEELPGSAILEAHRQKKETPA